MPGRFLGPIQWRFQGDIPLCQSFVQQARLSAGWLESQIDTGPSGVTHRAGRWHYDLGDGLFVEYSVLVAAGELSKHAIISISSNSTNTPTLPIQGGTTPPVGEFVFEMWHGWVRINHLPPHTVYCTTDLASYLTTGTIIPDTTPAVAQVWWGRGALGGVITSCDAGTYALAWDEGTLPELGVDNDYSYSNTTPPNRGIGFPSGEAIAVSQAILGAMREFPDVLPDGWSADWRELGVVRRPDTQDYYWVRCTDQGLWIAPIAWRSEVSCIPGWLSDGLVTGDDADMVRMALGWMTKPGVAQIEQLLDGDDLSSVYANGAASLHPYCGWQFYFQPEIASSAKMIQILCYQSGSTNRARKAEIDLSWDVDGIASATVQVGPNVEWGGPRMMFPTGEGWDVIVNPTGDAAGPADIYCWTTPQGVQYVQVVAPGSASTVTTNDTMWPNSGCSGCGSVNCSGTIGSISTSGSTGCIVYGVTSAEGSLNPITAINRQEWKAESNAGSAHAFIKGAQNYSYYGCSGMEYHSFQFLGDIYVTTLDIYAEVVTYSGVEGSSVTTLVFLPSDPGVAIGYVQEYTAGTKTVNENSGSVAKSFHAARRSYLPDGPIVEEWNGVLTNWVGSNAGLIYAMNWGDANFTKYAQAIGTPSTQTENKSMNGESEGNLALVLSNGTYVQLDYADWGGLFEGVTPVSAPWASVSWKNEAYQTSPTEYNLPTGLSEDAIHGMGSAFLGVS